jgi:hypothetical protein
VVSALEDSVLVDVEDDDEDAGVDSAVLDDRGVTVIGMFSTETEDGDDDAAEDEVSTGVNEESDIGTVVGNESDVGNVFDEATPTNELDRSVEWVAVVKLCMTPPSTPPSIPNA